MHSAEGAGVQRIVFDGVPQRTSGEQVPASPLLSPPRESV